MTNQLSLISSDRCDRDLFTSSQAREHVLNAAIVQAEIGGGLEEYFEILDAFYAEDIEVSGETGKEPIRGKAKVRSLLFNFLLPLHVMAETGGLSVSIRETPLRGDVANETHSQWTLDLVGVSGAVCTLSWCVLRKWRGSRVVYERHYDHQQIGAPLSFDDINSVGVNPVAGLRRPS